MTRRLQVRDVHDPIGRLVREWVDREGVSVLRYSELARDLKAEVDALIRRAQAEAYEDGMAEGVRTLREAIDVAEDMRKADQR